MQILANCISFNGNLYKIIWINAMVEMNNTMHNAIKALFKNAKHYQKKQKVMTLNIENACKIN